MSEYDRSLGRYDKTPVTPWAKMMTSAYRLLVLAVGRTKGIESQLDQFPGGVKRLAEPVQSHEQLPLFV